MRKIALLAALPTLLLASTAFAADRTDNPINAGDVGLGFTMGGLFNSTPGAFDNIGVGGRYFTSDDLAIRAGLGLSFGSNESKQGSTSSETASNDFRVEGGIEYYLMKNTDVGIYTGGILQLGFGGQEPGGETEISTFGVAIAGLLGAQYFFDDYVSIGAEYRLGFETNSTTTEVGDSETETSSQRFGTGSAAFLLTFYGTP